MKSKRDRGERQSVALNSFLPHLGHWDEITLPLVTEFGLEHKGKGKFSLLSIKRFNNS